MTLSILRQVDREVKIMLATGQIVTPRRGIRPTANNKVLATLARSFGAGDLPLSQTPIKFGQFKDLTFGQLVEQQGIDGIRYLDWLSGQDWVYDNTKARLALFLHHRNNRLDLELAYTSLDTDHQGGQWPTGILGDKMMFSIYGEGGRNDFEPNEFMVSDTYDTSSWRYHQDRAWLIPGGPERGVDLDPTPSAWILTDPWRMEQEETDEDGWVDQTRIAENDLPAWDADLRPSEELFYDEKTGVCWRAWQWGMDAIRDLDIITTEANEAAQALQDWSNDDTPIGTDWSRLAALVSKLTSEELSHADSLFERITEIEAKCQKRLSLNFEKRTVNRLVPPAVAKAILEARDAAHAACASLGRLTNSGKKLVEDHDDVTRKSRNVWRGLTPTGKKRRARNNHRAMSRV